MGDIFENLTVKVRGEKLKTPIAKNPHNSRSDRDRETKLAPQDAYQEGASRENVLEMFNLSNKCKISQYFVSSRITNEP